MLLSRIVPLAAVATLAVGGLVTIHAGGFDAIHDEAMVEQLMDHIGAEGPVRDRLREIHQDFVADQERFQARKALSHEALSGAMFADVFDERAIRDAAAEYAAVQADEFVAQGRMMQAVRDVLTPEQYEKLAEAHGGIGGHGHGPGHGHGHGHGGGHPKR